LHCTHQAALLREASPVIAALMKRGKLKAIAGFYDLASGIVTLLGRTGFRAEASASHVDGFGAVVYDRAVSRHGWAWRKQAIEL
jgi:hypothetical protein